MGQLRPEFLVPILQDHHSRLDVPMGVVIVIKRTCKICGKEFNARSSQISVCKDCRTGVCVVCGKTFEKHHPYNQKTCSAKCRGIYRKESGIAKASRAKAEQTFKLKYDNIDIPRAKYSSKICKYCGKEFIPNSARQIYCNDTHYGKCPICGKTIEVDPRRGPVACSEVCKQELARRTSLEKYGVENPFQSKELMEKSKQTLIEKYGVEYYSQTEKFKDQYKSTMLEKYGVEFPLQSQEILDKVKSTNRSRYGVDWVQQNKKIRDKVIKTTKSNGGYTFQRPELVEKIKQTNLERYGNKVPIRTEAVKQKIKNTMIERYGAESPMSKGSKIREQIEQTNLERYGSKSSIGSETVRQKAYQTVKNRYGVDNVFQSEEIKQKIHERMLQLYGVDNPRKSEDFRKKAEITSLRNYGVTNYAKSKTKLIRTMQDPTKVDDFIEFRNNVREWIQSHYSDKMSLHELSIALGVDLATVSSHILKNGCQDLIAYNKSTFEIDIINFIKSIKPDVKIIHNDRKVIGPREIDVYLPEYKLGIECNPTYTHNSSKPAHYDDFVVPVNYHRDKSLKALQAGIFLFHIYGYQWTNAPQIVKSMIRHQLGMDEFVYYARNLTVREVSDFDSKRFLDKNHIQGYSASKIRLGLYNGDELICLMTFTKQRSKDKSNVDGSEIWELTRFCTKLNSRCVGGASKLFKHFIKMFSPDSVISFSSIDNTTGTVYEKMGFSVESTVPPRYVWVDLKTDLWYSRMACQKSKLPKLLNEPNLDTENQTEKQIMESHGFVQVYNSGLLKWMWTNE